MALAVACGAINGVGGGASAAAPPGLVPGPAAPAAAAPAAGSLSAAGTLLFIKDHNLWMARGNGTDAVALTDDGTEASPYASPSMADNGRFAYARNGRFHVHEPDGRLVAAWEPSQLFLDSRGGWMPPPFDPVISPDGTKVAYEQVRTYTSNGRFVTEGLTGISPVGSGGFADSILLYNDPTWLTPGRLALGTGSISLYDLGSGVSDPAATRWFSVEDYAELGDFEWSELGDPHLSPDGRTMMVTGASGNQLHWVRVTASPRTGRPAAPTQLVCAALEPGELPEGELSHYEDPDYGPEPDAAVYEQYGDIFRIDGIEACSAATTLTKIVEGGSDPDWSAVPYAPPAPTGPAPTPAPTPGPTTGPTTGAAPTPTQGPGPGQSPGKSSGGAAVKMKGKVKVKGGARVGGKLKVRLGRTTPAKVTRKITWMRNGKKIKRATKAVYRVTRADRGRRISVKVVLRAKGVRKLVVRSKAVRVR